MTNAALGFGLVRLADMRLRGGPDALRSAAGTVETGGDQDLATQFRTWADELESIQTIEATLRVGDSTPPRVPAITFHLVSDDFTPDVAPALGVTQRARALLAVVHIVDAINTPRAAGAGAVDPLEDLVGATQSVLHGWRPYTARNADALALQRGRLLGPPVDGRAMWQDEYLFSWQAPVHRVVHDAF